MTQNFFSVLGVQPADRPVFHGGKKRRTTIRRACRRGTQLRLLGAAFRVGPARVVGQKLTLNNKPVTIIGVMPAIASISPACSRRPIQRRPSSMRTFPLTEENEPVG